MKKIIISWMFFSLLVFCQKGNIKGRVIDSKTNQPLVGAHVLLIGTDLGAATDKDGYYLIKNADENVYKIKINYIGYHSHIEPDIRVIRDKTFFVKEISLNGAYISSDEVTVTSGYFNENIDMPVSNYSYSKDEIVRAPGAAGDIFRAIDVLPGVSSSGGEFSSFSVRGGSPKDNLILIDNIPFSKITHFSEASGDEEIEGGRFSIFTTGLIEKANFQAGGFGAAYGGKSASFLDLHIKEGNRESFSLNGTYDLFGWEVNYDGPTYLLKNTSMIVSARSQDFKTIFKLMDEEGQGNIGFEDYIVKITSNVHRNHKISLLGIYATEKSKRDVSHLYKDENLDNRNLRDEPEDKMLLGLNWRFLTGKKSFLNSSVYYGVLDQDQKEGKAFVEKSNGEYATEKEAGLMFPMSRYKTEEKQFGVKTDFTYNISENYTFHGGFNFQNIKRKSSVRLFAPDTLYEFDKDELFGEQKFLIINPEDFNSDFDKGRNEYAVYTTGSIRTSKRLNLNVGLRFEYDDFSEQSDVSPRFSGSYKLNNLTSLNFAAGIYNQLPELNSVSGNIKNHALKKEKSYHYILGLTHYLQDDVKLTVEGYYKKLSDLLVKPSRESSRIRNSGKGYAYGVDVSLIKRFVNKLYGQINYSYSVSKFKENDNVDYINSTFNQPHIFNVLVGYQFNDNWSLTAKWKYASGRPKDEYIVYSDVHNNENKLRFAKVITSENSTRFNDFHALNLRVDYRKQFSRNFAIIAYLDLMNVYNQENAYTEEFIPVTGKSEAEGLKFLPTIGFKIEI